MNGVVRALSIRQPYAELILRGIKRIEYRSRPTKIIGERFYIYAARKWAGVRIKMSEVRDQISDGADAALSLTSDLCPRGLTSGLPTGVIVGTAIITECRRAPEADHYEWHLSDVKRLDKPRKPKGKPQPVWFRPFGLRFVQSPDPPDASDARH
jgi:hypothetical protein